MNQLIKKAPITIQFYHPKKGSSSCLITTESCEGKWNGTGYSFGYGVAKDRKKLLDKEDKEMLKDFCLGFLITLIDKDKV